MISYIEGKAEWRNDWKIYSNDIETYVGFGVLGVYESKYL